MSYWVFGIVRFPYSDTHENIVQLSVGNSISLCLKTSLGIATNLLVANSEFALCLLVLLCKGLQFLDWFGLRNGHAKLDVSFGVLVARL